MQIVSDETVVEQKIFNQRFLDTAQQEKFIADRHDSTGLFWNSTALTYRSSWLRLNSSGIERVHLPEQIEITRDCLKKLTVAISS